VINSFVYVPVFSQFYLLKLLRNNLGACFQKLSQ